MLVLTAGAAAYIISDWLLSSCPFDFQQDNYQTQMMSESEQAKKGANAPPLQLWAMSVWV